MSSESTLILFGLFVAIVPYSGVPVFWYSYILPILGAVIIGIGFIFRSRRISSSKNDLNKTVQQSSSSVNKPEESQHKDPSPIS